MKLYVTDGDGSPYQDAEGCACLAIPDAFEHWYRFSQLHHVPAGRAAQLMQSAVYRLGTRPNRNGMIGPGDVGQTAAKVGDYCRRFPYGVVEVFAAPATRRVAK